MNMRWLILTLVPWAGGCDLGMDLTGLGDAFSCTNCWDVGGGGGASGGSRSPHEYFHGTVSYDAGPEVVAWVTLLGEHMSDETCNSSYAPPSDTICTFGDQQADSITGYYSFALRSSEAGEFAAYINRGTAFVEAELFEWGGPADTIRVRSTGRLVREPITSRPDSIIVIDIDFPAPGR
jgi:hypothetical protein